MHCINCTQLFGFFVPLAYSNSTKYTRWEFHSSSHQLVTWHMLLSLRHVVNRLSIYGRVLAFFQLHYVVDLCDCWGKYVNIRAPFSSVGRGGVPYTEALSSLQQIRVPPPAWGPLLCVTPRLSLIRFPVISSANLSLSHKNAKNKNKNKKYYVNIFGGLLWNWVKKIMFPTGWIFITWWSWDCVIRSVRIISPSAVFFAKCQLTYFKVLTGYTKMVTAVW